MEYLGTMTPEESEKVDAFTLESQQEGAHHNYELLWRRQAFLLDVINRMKRESGLHGSYLRLKRDADDPRPKIEVVSEFGIAHDV